MIPNNTERDSACSPSLLFIPRTFNNSAYYCSIVFREHVAEHCCLNIAALRVQQRVGIRAGGSTAVRSEAHKENRGGMKRRGHLSLLTKDTSICRRQSSILSTLTVFIRNLWGLSGCWALKHLTNKCLYLHHQSITDWNYNVTEERTTPPRPNSSVKFNQTAPNRTNSQISVPLMYLIFCFFFIYELFPGKFDFI